MSSPQPPLSPQAPPSPRAPPSPQAPPSPGGFLHYEDPPIGLLSPSASVASSTLPAGPHLARTLPEPRHSPLKLGGSKESAFIRHVDHRLMTIQGRFAKRGDSSTPGEKSSTRGYQNFGETAADLAELVDLVWVSGTPSLQVPYLLSIALLIVDFIPGLPPSRRSMFALLGKLDHAFSSLLVGYDTDTRESLPGSSRGRLVSGTEKVRIKSLVERTRIVVNDAMSNPMEDAEDTTQTEVDANMGTDTEMELEFGVGNRNQNQKELEMFDADDVEMEMTRVYDRTIVELSDTIGGTPIGIITDD